MTSTATAVAERPDESRRNITPFDEIVIELDDLYAEVGNWADGSPVENQAQCDALDVLDKALLDLDKRREAIRKDEARPFDEGKAAVQAKHNPVKDKIALARDTLNPIRAAWKAAELRRKEEALAKAREEEQRLMREAEEKMRASSGNLAEREVAEEMLATAKEAQKFASRQEKRATTGTGLRTSYEATVTDLNAAIKHYWGIRRADFQEFVQGLADADVRRGVREIPGITINEIKKAL